MKKTNLTPDLIEALEKILRDETLSAEDKKHISEFLATDRKRGITINDVWNLSIVGYKLYDLFKDYLE
ncbi:hypothetical protein ACFQ21_05115 [Ohtaekwangia kribbensis]|uniref:Uncharacterized protein n=1 Tax=Ohtaekwangia kribbensis TaxID=688913 RepID=A0ABW3JXG3_9BACT